MVDVFGNSIKKAYTSGNEVKAIYSNGVKVWPSSSYIAPGYLRLNYIQSQWASGTTQEGYAILGSGIVIKNIPDVSDLSIEVVFMPLYIDSTDRYNQDPVLIGYYLDSGDDYYNDVEVGRVGFETHTDYGIIVNDGGDNENVSYNDVCSVTFDASSLSHNIEIISILNDYWHKTDGTDGTGESTSSSSKHRLYSLTIKSGSTKLYDLCPALRESDNEPGLYDTVNDVFYSDYSPYQTSNPRLPFLYG